MIQGWTGDTLDQKPDDSSLRPLCYGCDRVASGKPFKLSQYQCTHLLIGGRGLLPHRMLAALN